MAFTAIMSCVFKDLERVKLTPMFLFITGENRNISCEIKNRKIFLQTTIFLGHLVYDGNIEI